MTKMMKVAALAGIAVAASAQGALINAGNMSLAGFGASAGPFNGVAGDMVQGLTLRADALPAGGFAFQTDMVMNLSGPGGLNVNWGPNFSTPAGNITWPVADPGSPQNSASAQSVLLYLSLPGGPAPAGNYSVTFTNGYAFNGPGDIVSWDSVTVLLDVVPAPASLALLGMGGLVAGRRRR